MDNDELDFEMFLDDVTSEVDIEAERREAKSRASGKRKLTENEVLEELMNSKDYFVDKYGEDSIESNRFITLKILEQAPDDFFNGMQRAVDEGVKKVQQKVSTMGGDHSSLIQKAKLNPLDEVITSKAFKLVKDQASDYVHKSINWTIAEREIIKALIVNELIGFSVIDPMWRDDSITEIICNGPYDLQFERKGSIHKIKCLKFRDEEHIENFIKRLYEGINKRFSPVHNLSKGRLHDNSRMMAIHQVVAQGGPNFNIRRHHEDYIGPDKILEWETVSKELMEYLGNLINKGASWVVSGGTGTGKTTLLCALTAFYRPKDRIVTLEDNLEMKIHPNKQAAKPMECVPDNPETGKGGVTMRDLVKASTQIRPECIVIGEVTDGAAYDLVQALNTGHYGASTVHANSQQDGINRLSSLIAQSGTVAYESALPLLSSAFDLIIQIERFAEDGSRKVVAVSEVSKEASVDKSGKVYLETKDLWRFEPYDGLKDGKVVGEWVKVGELSEERKAKLHLNLGSDMTLPELMKLAKVRHKDY